MNQTERAIQLEERLIDFAVRIVKSAETLPNSYAGQHFGSQIIRSGSAPALLYAEARSAESIKDFRHKLSIVLKELRETFVTLRLIVRLGYVTQNRMGNLQDENNQLISIFVATIKTIDQKLSTAKTKKRS